MRSLFFSFCFVALLLSSSASAQEWTQVSTPPSTGLLAPYFINPQIGFLFPIGVLFQGTLGATFHQASLSRTTNGGLSWAQFPFWDNEPCSIAQIYFISARHGYLAALSVDGVDMTDAGIYETLDTGSTWKKISPAGKEYGSIYATETTVFATEIVSQPTFGVPTNQSLDKSLDNGKTWSQVSGVPGLIAGETPLYQYITGNKEGLVTAIYYDSLLAPHIVYSMDAGTTWNSRKLKSDQFRDWPMVALYSLEHRLDLIDQYVSDNDQNQDTYTLLRSTTNYQTAGLSLSGKEIGAWVAGTACVSYISSANSSSPGPGVFRTLDQGRTWQLIDGPQFDELDDDDYQNLSVVGHGAVVYATDLSGFLWKTTTGGDGTLSAKQFSSKYFIDHLLPNARRDTITILECGTDSMQVFTQSLSCNYSKLVSLTITGLDPSEYTHRIIHHWNTDGLPDTSIVVVKPISGRIRNLVVHTTFIDDEYETTDMTFPITLSVVRFNGSTLSIHEKQASITGVAGDSISLPVYFSTSKPVSLGPTSIGLTYRINTDLLEPIAFISASTLITVAPLTITPTEVSTVLNAPTGVSVNAELLLGWLRCRIMLVDSSSSDVALRGVTVSTTGAGCVTQSSPTDIVHVTRTNLCGDTTLLRYMRHEPIGNILSIVPNPSSTELRVRFQNPSNGLIAFELLDAMGRQRLSGSSNANDATIDVSSLSSGVYFFRAISAKAATDTRRIVVSH